MPVIELTGVRKSYGDLTVLRDLDLVVRRGEVVALLGPNGAGKTTTVRIVTTLTRPDGGTARVCGYDVVREPAAVRRRTGLTGQHVAVDGLLSATENLVQVGRLRGLDRRTAHARATDLLARFDLTEAAGRRAASFSGGMRRRLDLAVGLVTVPDLLVLDEPTTGLDPRSRLALWDVVLEQAARGVAVLLTTQYLEEADRLADRIAVIDGGRVVAEGTAEDLKGQVGVRRLDVVLHDRDDAAAVAARARDLVGTGVEHDVASATVRIPTTGAGAEVRDLLDRLDPDRRRVSRFDVRTASLDDVFLALTGTTTDPQKETSDA